jgi:hypothetical protein
VPAARLDPKGGGPDNRPIWQVRRATPLVRVSILTLVARLAGGHPPPHPAQLTFARSAAVRGAPQRAPRDRHPANLGRADGVSPDDKTTRPTKGDPMLTRKLAASLAVAASLALAPAAFAGPEQPHPPAEPAPPPSGTYLDQNDLIAKCRMLREGAVLARNLGQWAQYLAIADEYERLNCERHTGPLPPWS